MKKILLALPLIAALLLSGCGGRAAQSRYEQFRQQLCGREALSFRSAIRCEYPDKTVEFGLSYRMDSEGETVTVLAPDLIRGVSTHLSPGSSRLEFDGMILDTGDLSPYGLTPMSALPRLVETMRSGHLESQWEEDGLSAVELLLDDHCAATVWLEPEEMIPRRAELTEDGRVKVFCEISDWS